MIISPTSTASTAAASGTAAQASPVISSDFETFIKMLTTQAKYQDPLEPIDSSQYAAQLAQLSMVEQQVMSNDLLTALTEKLGSGDMAQMAGWIGMEARTTAPVLFEGRPVTVTPNPAAVADEVFLVVHDETGREVQRSAIPVSADLIEWAGVDDDGTPFPNGLYRFEVESHAKGQLLLTDPAETYARVTEARTQAGETALILRGGSAVLTSSISGLREPI